MEEGWKVWLEGMGFAESNEKHSLYWKKVDDGNGTAYWDFRGKHADKGNFFVAIEGSGFEDNDKARKRQEYTGLRDLQAKKTSEQETIEKPPEKKETPKKEEKGEDKTGEGTAEKQEPQPESPPSSTNDFEKIREIVGNDVLEIFGPTGSGKSKIAWSVAKRVLDNNKTLFYLDTERNLSDDEIKSLGDNYRYTPMFSEIEEIAKSLPKADVYIVDSLGFPVLTAFSRMNMRQRGDALLGMISILGSLKEKCYKEGALAIVTNQPISELGVEEGAKVEDRRPFGDKAGFAAKEIWRTNPKTKGKDKTVITVDSWRSRNMGFGKVIAEVDISDKGVVFNWKV